MRIQFDFFIKMVFCFSFIVNCAKPDAPIKGPKHVEWDLQTCLDAHGQWVSLNRMLFRRFIYKYKLSQKSSVQLNIYKIVIRHKSQVLRKEDSRLVAVRQTYKPFFCSCSKPLEHRTDTFTPCAARVVQSHHHIFSLC